MDGDRFGIQESDLVGIRVQNPDTNVWAPVTQPNAETDRTIYPKGVAKVGDPDNRMAKTWKTLEPMWQAPASENRAVSRYRKILTKAFAAAKPKVAAYVRANLAKTLADVTLRKDASDIADDLPLDDIEAAADDLADVSGDVADDVSRGALARVGVGTGNEDVVDKVSARAVARARARAAELVGKSWDEASQSYVDNPDPSMAITETTRAMIRDIIANGLDDNLDADEIASQIEDSTGFSPERADLIAKTEIARVNSDAALSAYSDAASNGVSVKKRWIVAAQDVCDVCADNAKQAPMDVDAVFKSGDQSPPAHPNCRCAVAPVVADPNSEDTSDE